MGLLHRVILQCLSKVNGLEDAHPCFFFSLIHESMPHTEDDHKTGAKSSFLCHTSMSKGGREQELDRTFNPAVLKKAESCPLATDFTALGVRGITCNASTQSWKPPMWVSDKKINSKAETSSCATTSSAGMYASV